MEEKDHRLIADLLRKPEGEHGAEMGRRMNESNRLLNILAIDSLAIKNGDQVLEIGMGNGFFVQHILSKAKSVAYTGCDYSKTMVEEAKKLNHAIPEDQNVQFHLSNVDQLPFADGSFDKILTVNTIYFWEDPRATLKRLKRLLKPAGQITIAFRHKEDMAHYPFTKYGFQTLSFQDVERIFEECSMQVFENIEKEEPAQEFDGHSMKIRSLVISARTKA